MKVAFDIDDTLLIPNVATGFANDTPNYDTVALYKWFQDQGNEMVLWSGSGMDWAQTWGEKLGLQPFTVMKKEKVVVSDSWATDPEKPGVIYPLIDIAFDDCDVDLAKVNVKVKRVNNRADRSVWNKTKREKYGEKS